MPFNNSVDSTQWSTECMWTIEIRTKVSLSMDYIRLISVSILCMIIVDTFTNSQFYI